jgi:hypothetical protein
VFVVNSLICFKYSIACFDVFNAYIRIFYSDIAHTYTYIQKYVYDKRNSTCTVIP